MPTTVLVAASIFSFERGMSTPNAVCSIGVERPIPHSTRPCDSTSTVATLSVQAHDAAVRRHGCRGRGRPTLFVRAPGAESLTLAEHQRIIDAIAQGNAEEAAKAMSDHLTRASDLYRQAGL